MVALKNRLIEMVLLSTHNICFGLEIRKLNFCYTLLTKVLYYEDNILVFHIIRALFGMLYVHKRIKVAFCVIIPVTCGQNPLIILVRQYGF